MRELMRSTVTGRWTWLTLALVRVAEREKIRTVFRVDRGDFEVYRPSRLGRFAIIPR